MRTNREVIKELTEQGALDGLFAQIDSGQLQLTGEGGFVPGLIKAALQRGLHVELADHVGYEKGDPEAHLYPNSRNGASAKTMASQVGDVDLDIPRDRARTLIPLWCLGVLGATGTSGITPSLPCSKGTSSVSSGTSTCTGRVGGLM
jgi:hypothetical protein